MTWKEVLPIFLAIFFAFLCLMGLLLSCTNPRLIISTHWDFDVITYELTDYQYGSVTYSNKDCSCAESVLGYAKDQIEAGNLSWPNFAYENTYEILARVCVQLGCACVP